jgi:hypothetical protein
MTLGSHASFRACRNDPPEDVADDWSVPLNREDASYGSTA